METEATKKEEDRLAKEQRLRKTVYDAIVTLSECVDETILQKMLNSLDQSSWMEVVEERYLGRMCGFPLCTNSVVVRNSQKYRIDLKNKKVFERSAEIDKFCCHDCFLRSAAVRAQLETEPIWIRGDERVKIFDLNVGKIIQQRQNTCDFEFSEDQQLITSLEVLKIGDVAESDNEDNDDEISMDEEKRDDAHEEFYNLCRSYLTKRPAVSSTDKSIDETVTKMEIEAERRKNKQHSESEKLARIRNKYNQRKLKRPPEIIEAKPLSSQLSDKVHRRSIGEDFKKTLSEWCGPETMYYLQYHHRMDLSDNEDEVVTEARSIIARFYAGDRLINKKVEEDVFLPPVDNINQARQRISVLAELLKPSWRILEGRLGINGCGQQALGVISTFRLSATNVVLERKLRDLAVAVIFRLLAYRDRSLMDFYSSDSAASSRFMQYLEQIGYDAKYYFEVLSVNTSYDWVFMVAADLCVGYLLLALSAVIFPYLLIWIYIMPFTSQDFIIRMAFPSQFFALLFPLVCFISLLSCMGISSLMIFVGQIRQRSFRKK
uniref:RNA polymerase II subunit B1 CTD phosphatase RPAP2 homolog n=1 Tax=Elaeophora elaphi TaxID=1147741 RepID=A0A0R3RHG0_9BILA